MNTIVNLLLYNLVWLICVRGGNGLAWLGLLLVAGHFLLSRKRRQDALLAAAVLALGLLIDGTLNAVGFFFLGSDQFPIPLWLAVIWLALATLPNHSLAWMRGRPLLCVLFGAIGGPLAYWGGTRIGAAVFNWPLTESLILLAVIWGLLWPAIIWIGALLDTGTPHQSSSIRSISR